MISKEGADAAQAKKDSVEGQIESKLNQENGCRYKIISHAYAGFTTSSVLEGDSVRNVLFFYSRNKNPENNLAYFLNRKINLQSDVNPLEDLKKSIQDNPTNTHYVIISVGVNNFPASQVLSLHEDYMKILQEVKSLEDRDIRPILMFQYRFDVHNDHYWIYTVMKVTGIFFATLQSGCVLGIGAAALSLMAKKTHRYFHLTLMAICGTVLFLSHQVIPIKVTKGILCGQKPGLACLGGAMETLYEPILAQAKADRLPILDLPNTFDPYNSRLYFDQIAPDAKGSQLIAEGIAHIVNNHKFSSSSKIYSKPPMEEAFTDSENSGSWSVAYPVPRSL